MPSARPEWIGLQFTTGLWVSATFSCSGVGQGFCLDGVRILEMSRHRNKLGIGHLVANQFKITVRSPVVDWQTRATAILSYLEKHGLPNYFGPQRFGRFNSNVIDAMRLLRGEKVPGGHGLHRLFFESLQSHLFNWILKLRIEFGLYRRVLNGDWAKKHDTGGMFVVEDGAKEGERAARLEISAALPLYGRKVRFNGGEAGVFEQIILNRFELSQSDLLKLGMGAWRISRVRIGETSIKAENDGYTVMFTLPKGSYATCLLRELVTPEVR